MAEEIKKIEELVVRKVSNGYAVVVGGGIDIYVAKTYQEASEIVDGILNEKVVEVGEAPEGTGKAPEEAQA